VRININVFSYNNICTAIDVNALGTLLFECYRSKNPRPPDTHTEGVTDDEKVTDETIVTDDETPAVTIVTDDDVVVASVKEPVVVVDKEQVCVCVCGCVCVEGRGVRAEG